MEGESTDNLYVYKNAAKCIYYAPFANLPK
jgi:hypothetical protein